MLTCIVTKQVKKEKHRLIRLVTKSPNVGESATMQKGVSENRDVRNT